MTGTAQIIRGDARHLPLADDSVDLVVTSPPYFALRSYQDGGEHYDGQIGDEATPAEFVDALIEVTRECVRVLKPSGSLWVNLGDKYAGGDASPGGPSSLQGGKKQRAVQGNRTGSSDAATRRPDRPRAAYGSTARPKSLIGIPWRYAIRCIDELGLILRAEVIWSKPNGLPESVTDRVRRSHEQWFHFTLAPRYFSAVDEIREAHSTDISGWKVRSQVGELRGLSQGANPSSTAGITSAMGQNPLGKLPGSVWTIPTEPLIVPPELGVDHFAAFPTEWPRRIIQGWSPAGVCVECGEGRRPVVDREYVEMHRQSRNRAPWQDLSNDGFRSEGSMAGRGVSSVGRNEATITGYACACPAPMIERTVTDTAVDGTPVTYTERVPDPTWQPTAPTTPGVVLDPFGGTGTTALVAKALGRHGISVDMSADYCRIGQWRTNDPAQLAKAARKPYTPSVKPIEGQSDLLDLLAEEEPA